MNGRAREIDFGNRRDAPRRFARGPRAYAARYSAMKRQKEGRGVERQKGAKSASVSSDDDAFLSERQTDAVVTREASSRELPEEEDPSEARVRMEAEMAVSLEEAVRARVGARDRQLRLTYVEPVPPPSRARAAEAYVREDETRDPRFPPTTPRRTYVRLHESREARARRLAERARRRARGEAVSSEDDDDVEAREATDTDVFKTVAFDPTNPLRRVSVPKHPGAGSSRPEVGRDEEKRATTPPPGVESARRRVVDAARARRESGAVKPPPNPTTPIKSISPWLRRDDESQPAATSQPVRSREDDIDDDLDGRRASAVGFSRTRVQALGRAVAGSSDDVSVSKPSGRKKAVSLAELKRRITLADVSRSRERAARPSPEAERLRGVSARLRGAVGGDRDGAETANGERTKNRFADHPVAIPVAVGVAVRNPDSTYGVALPSVPLPEETEDDRRERRERARVAAFVDARMPDKTKKKDGDENVVSRIRDSAVVSSARRDDTAESPRVSLPSPSAREREAGASSRVGPPKKRRLEMSAAATSLQTSGPARVSRPKNIGLGEALGDEGEGDEGDEGDEGISPDALVRGPVALGADDAYEAAHERFDDDGEGARGSGSDAPSRSKKSYAGTRSSGGPTRDAAGRPRPTRGSLAAEGPAPGKVRLPAGFRRAAPGEAGAMRAADAAASGLGGLAAAARDGDNDASASEAAETRASVPDGSLAGSARLARIAARFRGDAPRRPPVGKRGPVAAPATARRGSPPSAPAPAPEPVSAQAAGAGPVEAAKRRAAAGAAARVEAAAARRARASDGDAGGDASDGSAEGSTRDGDGDGVEDDADDDARRRGFNPPPPGTVVATSSSAPHSAGAGSPGGETVGGGEMVKMFSSNALEQVLREVAMRGGLDELLDAGDAEGDDAAVTAEDLAKIVALVKERRKEHAERARLKTDAGLRGKLASAMVGDGAGDALAGDAPRRSGRTTRRRRRTPRRGKRRGRSARRSPRKRWGTSRRSSRRRGRRGCGESAAAAAAAARKTARDPPASSAPSGRQAPRRAAASSAPSGRQAPRCSATAAASPWRQAPRRAASSSSAAWRQAARGASSSAAAAGRQNLGCAASSAAATGRQDPGCAPTSASSPPGREAPGRSASSAAPRANSAAVRRLLLRPAALASASRPLRRRRRWRRLCAR